MDTHLYRLTDRSGKTSFVKVTVDAEDDHFVSSSTPVDAAGNPLADLGDMAPKFYGVSKDQALRRMVTALENSYDEVEPCRGDKDPDAGTP